MALEILRPVHRALALVVSLADSLEPLYTRHIVSPRPRVLEASTGFGINTFILARVVERQGGAVVSVDMDPGALARAGRLFSAEVGRGVLRFEKADLRSLPYDDNSFDYVVSHATLHHVEGVGVAVGEMLRVLRPGGRLIIIDLKPSALFSPIPGHGRSRLRRAMEEALSILREKAQILDQGFARASYYVVVSKASQKPSIRGRGTVSSFDAGRDIN